MRDLPGELALVLESKRDRGVRIGLGGPCSLEAAFLARDGGNRQGGRRELRRRCGGWRLLGCSRDGGCAALLQPLDQLRRDGILGLQLQPPASID